jgi:CubicO group peptidase (beta-lactamase class C family)
MILKVLLLASGLPVAPPATVGMSADRLAHIDRVVQRGITAGGYPGAAVVIGRHGSAVFQKGYGRLEWRTAADRVSPIGSVYDLASLTKVVATTTAAMVLYDEGRLDLDAPVQRYLPAFAGPDKDRVTVRHLLTHHGGLAAGMQLWRTAQSPAEAKAQVLARPLVCAPGRCYLYSDLGADVLGWVLEAVSGESLDRFVATRVFAPLGMHDTFFRPSADLLPRIAPTEVAPPRGYPVRGEVHDENAFALGGVAGHAGLFSTAADLSVFAQMMLNEGEFGGVRIVRPETVRLFTRRAQGPRTLGWEVANGEHGAGDLLSRSAYGHIGFTGTSLWIDPDRQMFVVLLTNRVHAARARRPARVIADVRADLADAAALAITADEALPVLTMPAQFRADQAKDWNRPIRRARSSRRRPATTKAKPAATTRAKPAATPVKKQTPAAKRQ